MSFIIKVLILLVLVRASLAGSDDINCEPFATEFSEFLRKFYDSFNEKFENILGLGTPLSEISSLVVERFIEEFDIYYLKGKEGSLLPLSGVNTSDVICVIDGQLYPPPYPLDCIYMELIAIKDFLRSPKPESSCESVEED